MKWNGAPSHAKKYRAGGYWRCNVKYLVYKRKWKLRQQREVIESQLKEVQDELFGNQEEVPSD